MTLDEIRKLCDEATPGPWNIEGADAVVARHDLPHGGFVCDAFSTEGRSGPNAAFIAAARTLLPALLAVAEAAEMAAGTSPDECLDSHDELKAALRALEALRLP